MMAIRKKIITNILFTLTTLVVSLDGPLMSVALVLLNSIGTSPCFSAFFFYFF